MKTEGEMKGKLLSNKQPALDSLGNSKPYPHSERYKKKLKSQYQTSIVWRRNYGKDIKVPQKITNRLAM